MKNKIIFEEALCTACGACAVACMDQNDVDTLSGESPFRRCAVEEGGEKFRYLSLGCAHCEAAPCISACPGGCIYKDPETGFTLYNSENCIGCLCCTRACTANHPRLDKNGKMSKCDGCAERVKRGLKPACVRVCPFGALKMG